MKKTIPAIVAVVVAAAVASGVPTLQTMSMSSAQSTAFVAKPISLFSGSLNNDFIKEAYAAGLTDTEHSDGGITDVQIVEGTVKEISTSALEPPLITNATTNAANVTLSNPPGSDPRIALYICRVDTRFTMVPGGYYTIGCPVYALSTDGVIVTNNAVANTEVVSAFPTGDSFGTVLITVKNDSSVYQDFAPCCGISIMTFSYQTEVIGTRR